MNTLSSSIVLVDDDADDHYLISFALQDQYPAVSVDHLTSLDDWRTYLATGRLPPSLLLMDFRLPTARGLDLLNELKELQSIESHRW